MKPETVAAGEDIISNEQVVGEHLIFRSVQDEADVQRFIDLNDAVTHEGPITDRLLHHHPATGYENYFLVLDKLTNQAVSSTCLIPWEIDFDGVRLSVAMLEMVATRPDYRHRGLVRTQVERFHDLVANQGFDLSVIQGIPYYYRQYGYAYALDHTPLTVLTTKGIPAEPTSRYLQRAARLDDIKILVQLYQSAMAFNQLSVYRSAEYWHYLLKYMDYPVYLIEDTQTGQAVGYMTVYRHGNFHRVLENGTTSAAVALAGLQSLNETGITEVQVAGPPTNSLVQLARGLSGNLLVADQWLWRITDVARLLSRLKPVFERRLANSDWAGLTAQLHLNLYRQAYALKIESGRLTVESLGFVDASMGADGGDFCIPPEAFIRLLFGYRRLTELRDAWPDIRIKPASRNLLAILFPPLEAHILMPY